jgi:Transcriptional regulator SbtR-like, C-terminal domain
MTTSPRLLYLRLATPAGAALLGFVDCLIAEAALKRDLVDALASAGTELSAGLAGTGAQIRGGMRDLLVRAQASGAIRDDIGVDDLMTIVARMMFGLRRRPARPQTRSGPSRCSATGCSPRRGQRMAVTGVAPPDGTTSPRLRRRSLYVSACWF